MTERFSHRDYTYLRFPFGRETDDFERDLLRKAFKGDHKDQDHDTRLLHGFVIGEPIPVMESLVVFDSSERRLPTGNQVQHGDIEKTIKVQNIRPKLERWRDVIFSSETALLSIIDVLFDNSLTMREAFDMKTELKDWVNEIGLFEGITSNEKARRTALWSRVMFCMRECEKGITESESRNKYNSWSSYEEYMLYLRAMVGEQRDNPDYKEWALEAEERLYPMFDSIKERASGKKLCTSCTSGLIRSVGWHLVPGIMSVTSWYRPENPAKYYNVFVSGLISALLKHDLVSCIAIIGQRGLPSETNPRTGTELRKEIDIMRITHEIAVNKVMRVMMNELAESNAR